MIETAFAKRVRRIRTERRELPKQGWEHVGERGGNMWELYRGSRIGQRITDVRIAEDGISLWIKCADPHLSNQGEKGMSSPFHRELQSNIADAQRRPVPLKFAPPVGGFGDPEPAIYSHPNNLDHAAVARKQARDKPKTPTS